MQPLPHQILELAAASPEGTPLIAKEFLHLASRAALSRVLSRLAQSGKLLRIGRGIYVLPVESRFGSRGPSVVKVVQGLAKLGETIVPHGTVAANAFGLTTQVPMRAIFLTSNRSRFIQLGAQTVEFRHAPGWQLVLPGRRAGDLVRVLAWLGQAKAESALQMLSRKLSAAELEEVVLSRVRLPGWITLAVRALALGAEAASTTP